MSRVPKSFAEVLDRTSEYVSALPMPGKMRAQVALQECDLELEGLFEFSQKTYAASLIQLVYRQTKRAIPGKGKAIVKKCLATCHTLNMFDGKRIAAAKFSDFDQSGGVALCMLVSRAKCVKGAARFFDKQKNQTKSPVTYVDKVRKKQKSVESWADICELSDDEDKIISDLGLLSLDVTTSDTPLAPSEIRMPKGFKQHMPTWHAVLEQACKLCKLNLTESTSISVDQVAAKNLYSTNPGERAQAAKSIRASDAALFSAFNSGNSILKFFQRPIDVSKKGFNPNPGEAWVLQKIAYDYVRQLLGSDFDPALFKAGTRFGGFRDLLVEKFKLLFPGGDTTSSAEMLFGAFDALVYKYIQKVYSSRKESVSEYIKSVVDLVTKNGTQLIASHTRRIKVKVETKQGRGRNRTVQEKLKVSYIKPWVTQSEYHTARERRFAKTINEAFQNASEYLDMSTKKGPLLAALAGKKMCKEMWDISDAVNRLSKNRRKLIRDRILEARTAENKKEKITPEEWRNMQKTVIAEEATTDTDLCSVITEIGFTPEEDFDSKDLVESLTSSTNDALEWHFNVSINWNTLADEPDPTKGHALLVQSRITMDAKAVRDNADY